MNWIYLRVSKEVFKFTLTFYLLKQVVEVENLFCGRFLTFSISDKVINSSVVHILLLFYFVLFRLLVLVSITI